MTMAATITADFVHPPFLHQLREFEEHAETPARALFWTMRTGKTKVEIDKACHLFKSGKLDGVLIFAPNGVHANWLDREHPLHAWKSIKHRTMVWRSTVAGTKAWKKLAKSDQADWHARRNAWWTELKSSPQFRGKVLYWLAVNSESMTRKDVRKAIAYFAKHFPRLKIIFDESDDFGIPGAKRTKMARAVARRGHFNSILSGTSVTASPLAAFSQFELLEKEALGFERAGEFYDHYGDYEMGFGPGGRRFPKLVGFKNLDELQKRMARFCSVVLREDCHDMPDLVWDARRIVPTPQQLKAYRDLHHSFMVEIGNRKLEFNEKTNRLQKLQQIFSGWIKDAQGRAVTIPGGNPRLDALSEEVYLSPGKVIVWCEFKRDQDLVKQRLLGDGHKVVEYHGRVPDEEKPKSLQSFVTDGDVKALIGHPASGGRGLDMSVAALIVWYSHTFKSRLRVQAMERATKLGGKNIHVMDFIAPGPDNYILSVTDKRINVADDLAGKGMKTFLEGMTL